MKKKKKKLIIDEEIMDKAVETLELIKKSLLHIQIMLKVNSINNEKK